MHKQAAVVIAINFEALVLGFYIRAVKKPLDALHELAASLPRNDLCGSHALLVCFTHKLTKRVIDRPPVFRDLVEVEMEY